MKSNLNLRGKLSTLETGAIQYLSSSKMPTTSQISTVMPPRWNARKQYEKEKIGKAQRKHDRHKSASNEKMSKVKKVHSVGPFKHIEKALDGFMSETDKHWKTGAMQIGLMKNNPNLQEKFIIGPTIKNLRCYSPQATLNAKNKVLKNSI
jgi:hypothetical protein